MFIQTESTESPSRMRFFPGCPVLTSGTAAFRDMKSAENSPLAQRLFEIEGVTRVLFDTEAITLSKSDKMEWAELKPAIFGTLVDHFVRNEPVLLNEMATGAAQLDPMEDEDADPDVIAKIKDLIKTRIQPVAKQNGGDITYRGFKNGVVLLELAGSGHGMLPAVENMLGHYLPEIEGAADYRESLPRPGLETREGLAIRQLLHESINPQVASHGGHISLVDVQDDTVYIRLEGGCQGCGMADVTLKQGVATAIQRLFPTITRVLDVTDHAGGANPYYQPGKGGTSAL